MATDRIKPPHPRLQRLAREVGAEIPLPPARPPVTPAAEPHPAPARPRSFWFTLIRPDTTQK